MTEHRYDKGHTMISSHLPPPELYTDSSNRTTIAICFGIALPVIAVTLRLIAHKMRGLSLWADNYMIIFAAIVTIGNALVPIWANKGGNGRHVDTISKQDERLYFLALYIFEQTFGVANCAIKLSVLLLYRRIFETQFFRHWTTAAGILVIIWAVVKNLISVFQCTPVHKAWDRAAPGHCLSHFFHIFIGAQSFNITLDIIILALPITAVYRLHLPLYKRLCVIAIFAVGLFTNIVAIVRLAIVAQEILTHSRLDDLTWYTAKYSWSVMDPAVGCFAACMPMWSPLVKPLSSLPSWISSLRTRLLQFTSRRQRPAMLSDENDAMHLQEYSKDSAHANAEARKAASTDSRVNMLPKPAPGDIVVRKDFSQQHYRVASQDSPV